MLTDLFVNTAGTILGGAVLAYLHIYMERRDKELGRRQLVKEIKNRVYRPAVIVFVVALAMLQVTWNIITLLLVPIAEDSELSGAIIGDIPVMIIILILITGIVTVPISIYMHHRLPKYSLIFSMALIVTTFGLAVTEASIIAGEFPDEDDTAIMLSLLLITTSVLLPALYLGAHLAKKTEQEFIMTQLFKRLSQQDKKDLIDIVDSVPSVKDKAKVTRTPKHTVPNK